MPCPTGSVRRILPPCSSLSSTGATEPSSSVTFAVLACRLPRRSETPSSSCSSPMMEIGLDGTIATAWSANGRQRKQAIGTLGSIGIYWDLTWNLRSVGSPRRRCGSILQPLPGLVCYRSADTPLAFQCIKRHPVPEGHAGSGLCFFIPFFLRRTESRDCHFADALSPSLLKHLLKVEGGAAE